MVPNSKACDASGMLPAFRLVREAPCQAFGRDVVKQTWEWRLAMRPQAEVSTARSRRTAAGISAALVPP